MQKLEGDGLVFVHAGGTVVERVLKPGETLHVDTGCLVALEKSVQFEIEQAGNIKTALFGGEGLFFAVLHGPGKIWLQSLPFSRLAGRMLQAAPQRGGSRGEGSILGGLGKSAGWRQQLRGEIEAKSTKGPLGSVLRGFFLLLRLRC